MAPQDIVSPAPKISRKRRPNILYVMFDQLAPQFLPSYGHQVVKAPNLSRLAAEGVQFDSAYTNSPLCAPARFSMMAGQLCSRTGAWDNAAEFPSSIPTFAHYLRLAGYRTCLSGKMHFVGPDQLHGFEDRVTTDMYPGDFGWTPTWEEPERIHWWFHNMLSVTEAGPYDRSLEMEHDDEVAYTAQRWLYEHTRGNDERPFMLCVSFMQPHDPYLGPRAEFESYREDDIDLPAVPYVGPDEREPVGKRMYDLYDRDEYRVTERHVRAARRGYYAMITYSDRLLGQVLRALEQTGQADDTIVVVSADHGDMLGERGLWYKMNFFEHAARVPMIVHAPKVLAPRRIAENVSLMDLLPTFCEIATDGKGVEYAAPVDGSSVLDLAAGSSTGRSNTVFGEYMAEGTFQPAFMIRRGRWKYISCVGDPDQLYDVSADPSEIRNLAADPKHNQVARSFAGEVAAKWDSTAIRAKVVESQRNRVLIQDALLKGKITPWDFQPFQDAAKQYNRNYGAELYDTDRRARIPFRPEPERDGKGAK
ncbi:MAG TPA: choline-sulfatase [Dongiaceae bacterium]|nr:choline-sulfatase [Dongiaceae bacterium]